MLYNKTVKTGYASTATATQKDYLPLKLELEKSS